MINAILLLFLAYLNPNAELQTTLVDTVYISSTSTQKVEVVKGKNDLKKVNKIYGDELKLPESYFFDEVFLIAMLSQNADPETFKIINTFKDEMGNYKVVYTTKEKDGDIQSEKTPYAVLKVKPVANKKADFIVAKIDSTDPIVVNQSLGTNPTILDPLDRLEGSFLISYFPLDNGNSWTYRYGEKDNLSNESTFNIIAFSEGWSLFDSFFGKKNVGVRFDIAGNLLLASDKKLHNFYTEEVEIKKSDESFTVKAGTFKDLVIASVPKNEKFWFKDIYANGVGLIYHEHHSPKGSSYYELQNAEVRGKSIP